MENNLEWIYQLSDSEINGLINRIKTPKVKLAVIFMADAGLRLSEISNLTPLNLKFDPEGKLEAIVGLRYRAYKTKPMLRTIQVKLLKEHNLLSEDHERQINEILSSHKAFKVSPRAVQIRVKKLAHFGFKFTASDLRDYFVFKALRNGVDSLSLMQVFDIFPYRHGKIFYAKDLQMFDGLKPMC